MGQHASTFDHAILSRRMALGAGLGVGAATLAGCTRGGGTAPSPSPTPTPAPAQWVASDALSPALVKAIDLEALNKKAGLTLGNPLKDQYGPYRPLRLPTGHRLLTSRPTTPTPEMLAKRSMSEWRELLRVVAPLFVREVLDPPELWVHDMKMDDAWQRRVWSVLIPNNHDPKVDSLFGETSFMNTDGKLADRLGLVPAKRSKPVARFGIDTLQWTVHGDKDGPWLQVAALARSHAVAEGVPTVWSRVVRLYVRTTPGWVQFWTGFEDNQEVELPDPARRLPVLRLGPTPSGWAALHHTGFGFSLPQGSTKQKPAADYQASYRLPNGGSFDVGLEESDGATPRWWLVPHFQNTRFTLPTGQLVLAEWGNDSDTKRFICRAWVQGKKRDIAIRFTSSAKDAASDLRNYAASWRFTE